MRISFRVLIFLTTFLTAAAAFGSPTASELLNKKGFSWRTIESEHVRVHVESENKLAVERIDYLRAKQEQAYIVSIRLLGSSDSGGKVDVFVVASRNRMKKLVNDGDTNGVAFPTKRVICFIFNETLDVSSPHEMMHVLAGNIWGLKFKPWISEGWAGVADDGWHGYELYNLNKYLLERRRLFPIRRLVEDFRGLPNMISYPQAAAFVKFVHDKYGREAIRSLWSDATVSGVKRLTGKDLGELEADWHKRLMEADSAEIVYNY
jgi:gamma-glutamylcyclotransferase (GGCT)/AIG2-like uncharacterized protein YtfP